MSVNPSISQNPIGGHGLRPFLTLSDDWYPHPSWAFQRTGNILIDTFYCRNDILSSEDR